MANLSNAVSDKLHFNIINKALGVPATVALFSGNIDTMGAEVVVDSNDVATVEVHRHNIEKLIKAGYAVHAILDDMTAGEVADGGVAIDTNGNKVLMQTVNQNLSLRHMKEYLAKNPRWVKSLTLICDNQAMFESSMSLATLSPFHKENEREINLSQYFSVNQFQGNKIVIPFPYNSEEGLQLNDNLLWTINGIPSAASAEVPTSLTVIIDLY